MSDWRHVPAGKIARQRREIVRLEPGTGYRTMGVRWYGKGGYARGFVTTETVKAKFLYRAREGDFTFNRIDTHKGAFDVVSAELDGALATNEFPLYEVNEEEVDARFLLLNFQRSEVLRQISAMRAGSEGRARWKEADFEAWVVPVPPLPVQGRIIEVIGAVENQITALDAEADSLLRLRNAALGDILSRGGEGWSSAPLSKVGTLGRGRRFVKSDYVHSGLGCIHYGQIYTDHGASATRTVTYLPESFRGSMRLAQPGDVVIAGTSENVEDVGKAVAWLGDDDVAVHDDCFIFRHDLDPKFVSYFFASPLFHHMKRRFTSETKVVRVSAANLNKIVMPVPPRDEQERISGMADAMDTQVAALRAEAERLRQARVALLSGLLDRTIDIESAKLEV
ncbi:restriction endonuclease subunit S [Micromonospora sp. NPDC005220]|uniref:restriction endonuclease subunit S n=1 Tax=Micromonospora sp. NPDC005220 TaxID=3155589 RepID=UPI0033B63595